MQERIPKSEKIEVISQKFAPKDYVLHFLHNMLHWKIRKNPWVIENCYKIPESMSEPVSPENLDLIIIPALCVDKNGYRIGYGKGYYDKFLKDNSTALRAVLVYNDLFVDDVHHVIALFSSLLAD